MHRHPIPSLLLTIDTGKLYSLLSLFLLACSECITANTPKYPHHTHTHPTNACNASTVSRNTGEGRLNSVLSPRQGVDQGLGTGCGHTHPLPPATPTQPPAQRCWAPQQQPCDCLMDAHHTAWDPPVVLASSLNPNNPPHPRCVRRCMRVPGCS